MFANSAPVDSPQPGIHSGLGETVHRHLGAPWRAPVPAHTARAFAQAQRWRARRDQWRTDSPLLLDSGCGTGASSVQLALSRPDALVIGLDKSAARLARAPQQAAQCENLLLLRADSAHFLRLLVEEGWTLERHYILYPNPWPRPGHLGRRWHGHPVFPFLLRAGGTLEMRSNWKLYLDEMQAALAIAGVDATVAPLAVSGTPLTPFEAKYDASGHALWRLTAQLQEASKKWQVKAGQGKGRCAPDQGPG